jgi:hypothetical protein
MHTKVRINQVRLGSEEFRVVSPARPVSHAVAQDSRFGVNMFVDRMAAVELASLWALAARSKHSLIYVPMRCHTPPRFHLPQSAFFNPQAPLLDVVLLHHSAQFPTSRWKLLRRQLGQGLLSTIRLPQDELIGKEADELDHARSRFADNRDHLEFLTTDTTLFVVGSPTAFRESTRAISWLHTDAPAKFATNLEHVCAELGWYGNLNPHKQNTTNGLHIDYCPTWAPTHQALAA